MNILKHKEKILKSQSHHYNAMSVKTKDFIKKICYRKTASVDMTQYGFIADTKVHPWRVLIKPLKEQLDKICGKPTRSAPPGKQTPAKRSQKGEVLIKDFPLAILSLAHTGRNYDKVDIDTYCEIPTMINSRSRRLSVINKRIKPSYVKDGSKRTLTKIQNDKTKKEILKAVNKKIK